MFAKRFKNVLETFPQNVLKHFEKRFENISIKRFKNVLKIFL